MHAGLLLSKYLPGLVRRLKPVLSAVALLDTCACVGASLSSNAAAARTRTGALVLVPVSAQQKQPALAPDLRIEWMLDGAGAHLARCSFCDRP